MPSKKYCISVAKFKGYKVKRYKHKKSENNIKLRRKEKDKKIYNERNENRKAKYNQRE
jgi:hypothetical protein